MPSSTPDALPIARPAPAVPYSLPSAARRVRPRLLRSQLCSHARLPAASPSFAVHSAVIHFTNRYYHFNKALRALRTRLTVSKVSMAMSLSVFVHGNQLRFCSCRTSHVAPYSDVGLNFLNVRPQLDNVCLASKNIIDIIGKCIYSAVV